MKTMIGMILIGLVMVGCDDNVVGASQTVTDTTSTTIKYDTVVVKPQIINDTIITKMPPILCYYAELKSSPGNGMWFCNEYSHFSSDWVSMEKTCKISQSANTDTRIVNYSYKTTVYLAIHDTCRINKVQYHN